MVRRTGWILLSVMVGLVVGGIATGLVDPLPSLQAQTTFPLTVQPETGRVGIGTMSPTQTLDVNGATRVGGRLVVGDQLDVAGQIRAGAGTAIYTGSAP